MFLIGNLSGKDPPVSQEGVEEEPNHQHGWQKLAARSLEIQHLSDTRPTLSPTDQAMLRSQGGPLAAAPFLALPTSRLTKLDPSVFRTLLLRRLRLPLPLTMRVCGCGPLLDAFGHHRSACAVSGVLGRRGFALESAMARICREAGARVMTNVLVRDLDLNLHDHVDARRLEIVADGLPLFGGAQLAIDTTLVSAVRQDGTPRPGATVRDGVALREARRRKERVYPEVTGVGGRARLVVIAGEVGGRWSSETAHFLSSLATAKARSVPQVLEVRARMAWRRRWASILSCAAARSFALSLGEVRASPGVDGEIPSVHEWLVTSIAVEVSDVSLVVFL